MTSSSFVSAIDCTRCAVQFLDCRVRAVMNGHIFHCQGHDGKHLQIVIQVSTKCKVTMGLNKYVRILNLANNPAEPQCRKELRQLLSILLARSEISGPICAYRLVQLLHLAFQTICSRRGSFLSSMQATVFKSATA